jgi:hypothetical protein
MVEVLIFTMGVLCGAWCGWKAHEVMKRIN